MWTYLTYASILSDCVKYITNIAFLGNVDLVFFTMMSMEMLSADLTFLS